MPVNSPKNIVDLAPNPAQPYLPSVIDLHDAINAKRLRVEDVAIELGANRSTLYTWFSGKRPNKTSVEKIKQFLHSIGWKQTAKEEDHLYKTIPTPPTIKHVQSQLFNDPLVQALLKNQEEQHKFNQGVINALKAGLAFSIKSHEELMQFLRNGNDQEKGSDK